MAFINKQVFKKQNLKNNSSVTAMGIYSKRPERSPVL